MPKTEPFDKNTQFYESWFKQHKNAYNAELRAIRQHGTGDELINGSLIVISAVKKEACNAENNNNLR